MSAPPNAARICYRAGVLPAPPRIELDVVGDRTAEIGTTGGFADIARPLLVARYPDGTKSASFSYDNVARRAIDAAVMAAHYVEGGRRWVYLRSAIRPPMALRNDGVRHPTTLWELPAGLIEPGESPAEAAARELEEELGFVVGAADMRPLGRPGAPAPALIGELHYFFHVEVAPAARRAPTEDGSPLERGAVVVAVTVAEAVEACRAGAIWDEKTEVGLRRLAELPLP